MHRFFFRSWEYIHKSEENEILLVTIDPSINPQWYSEITFYPVENNRRTHEIKFGFKKRCDDGKLYPSGEVLHNGEEVFLLCEKNFLTYIIDGTGKKKLMISIGSFNAEYEISEKTKFALRRAGLLNKLMSKIACI